MVILKVDPFALVIVNQKLLLKQFVRKFIFLIFILRHLL